MNLLDHLRRMARNNLWSNDRLYRAVLQLKPGEFEAERTSFFPSIKETLNHILAVDLSISICWRRAAPAPLRMTISLPFDTCTTLAQAQARVRPAG